MTNMSNNNASGLFLNSASPVRHGNIKTHRDKEDVGKTNKAKNKSMNKHSSKSSHEVTQQRPALLTTRTTSEDAHSLDFTANTNTTRTTTTSTSTGTTTTDHRHYYLPPLSPTYLHHNHPSHRPYKGFSTPFCGLFAASANVYNPHNNMHNGNNNYYGNNNINNDNPSFYEYHYHTKQSELQRAHHRTDLCSLTCFGILQSDYTRYLFTHTRPPSLCKRMWYHVLTPSLLFIIAGYCSGNIRSTQLNSIVCTLLVYGMILWIASSCCRGRKKRVMVRDEILWRLNRRDRMRKKDELIVLEEKKKTKMVKLKKKGRMIASTRTVKEEDDEDDSEDEEYDYDKSGMYPPSILGQSRREMHCAHRMLGCYPYDGSYHTTDLPSSNDDNNNSSSSSNNNTNPTPTAERMSSPSPKSLRMHRNKMTVCGDRAETLLELSSPSSSLRMKRHTYENDWQPPTDDEHNHNNSDDLCTTVWRSCLSRPLLPCLPLGSCCNSSHKNNNLRSYGFHCQLCGLCALAQEAREANIAFPRHLRMMDYITMEPFVMYYPRILELRANSLAGTTTTTTTSSSSGGSSSFMEHVRALSELSKLLLVSFMSILLALFMISLSDIVRSWNVVDMCILVTTFLQSFVVMYCVHWIYHRWDLSMDAVIKYFACGFALCTSMALTVEVIGLFVFKISTLIVVGWLDVQEVQGNGYGGSSTSSDRSPSIMYDDMEIEHRYLKFIYGLDNEVGHDKFLAAVDDILEGFFDRYPLAKILYILISSYLMAGIVEELCKYFGFFMVDHPDFCSEKELEKSHASLQLLLRRDDSEDETDGDAMVNSAALSATIGCATRGSCSVDPTSPTTTFRPGMQKRSICSLRSGITVAMVAVALGFACCENIFHIFMHNRSSVKSEIATLIMKSLFPMHPLAAAIQSVYVCRRDLEGDTTIGLGRTILPSAILRGTYEFALLIIGWSTKRGYNTFYQDDHVVLTGVAVLSFCVSLFLAIGGGYFYRRCSQAQYARLREESEISSSDNTLPETSFGLMV